MPRFDVLARTHASPPQVWSVLADVGSWSDWAPFDEVEVEHGREVGETRRLRTGPVTIRERVTGFEPPSRYVYECVSGLPVRDYLAEVLLSPLASGGTEIHWRATFRAKVPGTGWVLQHLLRRAIQKGATALAERADRLA